MGPWVGGVDAGAYTARVLAKLLGVRPEDRRATAVAFATLVAMDMVYRVRGQRTPAVPHGAMTTLTAIFLTGLLLRQPLVAGAAAALKLALWPWRDVPWPWTVLRWGAGLVAPLALVLARPEAPSVLLLAGPAIGEGIDRLRFYAELDAGRPSRDARGIALRTSLIPVVNSMFAVGLVALPGMMTGQILGGEAPAAAQRVVLAEQPVRVQAPARPEITVLCRSREQVEAALARSP